MNPYMHGRRMPRYAHGGLHPGGPAIVGEYGPELVDLPAGSAVTPTVLPPGIPRYAFGTPAQRGGGAPEGYDAPYYTPDDDPNSPYYLPPEPAPYQRPEPERLGFGDRLALALQGLQIPASNFGSGLAAGFAQGFSGSRVPGIQQRAQQQQDEERQARERERRTYEVRTAAQRLRAERAEKAAERAAAEANKVKVGPQIMREAGLPEMLAGSYDRSASILDLFKKDKPGKQRDERLVQVMGPGGVPIWVRESAAEGKPAAQAPRAVTGQERQVLAYYQRAKVALDDIEGGESGEDVEGKIATQGLPGQLQGQFAPNLVQTKDQQKYRQAQRAFTEARLRKESGAAIPVHEYQADAKTYFYQPGDTSETIEQKREARRAVLEGVKFSAGRAYDEFYGEPASYSTPGAAKPAQAAAPKRQKWTRDASGQLVRSP